MIPIKFPEANVVLGADQPDYIPLPAYQKSVAHKDPRSLSDYEKYGEVITCWKLSVRERLKLLFTGKVWHRQLTFRKPASPVVLEVNSPFPSK